MLQYLLQRRRIVIFIIFPLILAGLFLLNKLPIKMYPNIRKSTMQHPHPSYTAEDFYDEYRDTLGQGLMQSRR